MSSMSAWDHLPNAKHIDRVLASVKAHPLEWDQILDQAREQSWDEALRSAWGQINPLHQQAWDQVKVQAWVPILQDPAWQRARARARGALLALIAYDDSAKYLNLPIDQLEMLYQLSEHPACILLQPAVFVFEKEKELV
jgi:hypothetical protein